MLKKAFNPPGRAKRRKQVDLQTPGQPFANKAGLARSHQSAFQKARTHYPIDAYIGLGSNLDNPHQQVVSALAALAGITGTQLFAFSGLYMSRPMGPADQPAYINAVAWLKTGRTPDGLLAALQAIENRHGRIRHGARWGPRSLDLDILVYGKMARISRSLTIPHAGIKRREFVLYPLHAVAKHLMIPNLGAVHRLTARCYPNGLIRLT